MKKLLILLLAVVLVVSMCFVGFGCKATATTTAAETTAAETTAAETTTTATTAAAETTTGEPVTINVLDWRTEDTQANENINAVFMKEHPNITVKFNTITNIEYWQQVAMMLSTNTMENDIFRMQTFGMSKGYYKDGSLVGLNELIPELADLKPSMKDAYKGDDGQYYAVPISGTTIGILYNKDIFNKYGLKEPETWADFINICETLKNNGETVFASGTKDAWTQWVVYLAIGENYWGGEPTRQKVAKGEMKITSEGFINAFKAMESLIKYYPKNYQGIDYVTTQQMFNAGKAAMFMGGTWEIMPLKNMGLDFELGWFPGPVVNKGDTQWIYYSTNGYGLYSKSKNQEATITYLKWKLSVEANQLYMNELPGWFGTTTGQYQIKDPLVQKIWDDIQANSVTEDLGNEGISDKEPGGKTLFNEACAKLANKELTPEQAAKYVQDGLETWMTFK